jgi:hypothetical protein
MTQIWLMTIENPLGLQLRYGAQYANSVQRRLPVALSVASPRFVIADKLVRKIHLHPLSSRNMIIETIGAKMKLIVSNAVSKATGVQNVATMRPTRC